MRLRRIAAVALALAVFACVPADAGASGGHRALPVTRVTRIELEGSNGYSILVASGSRQHLVVKTTNEEFTTEYVTRDLLAAPDLMKAKLPGLASISVRFHPRGPARHPLPPGCTGRRPTVQRGVVRGTIRFVGEGGYTRVETHEAAAEIEEATSWRCSAAPEPAPTPPLHETWVSKFSARGEEASLLARKYEPGVIDGGEVIYSAYSGEVISEQPKLIIARSAQIIAPASTFQDAHPEHLAIAPPAPFVGAGRLSRTPESVFAWTGDLAIQFPGIDPIPLAGPGFGSDYCIREEGCIDQSFHSYF
jgi:hypothetical protein